MTRRLFVAVIAALMVGGQSCFTIAHAQDTRPILYVWSAEVGPNGKSWCRHCDKYWDAYKADDGGLRTGIGSRFRLVYVNADRNKLKAMAWGVNGLPFFASADGRIRIKGYTTPEDLLERLGIVWNIPSTQAQPAAPAVDVAELRAHYDAELRRLHAQLAEMQAEYEADLAAEQTGKSKAIEEINAQTTEIRSMQGRIEALTTERDRLAAERSELQSELDRKPRPESHPVRFDVTPTPPIASSPKPSGFWGTIDAIGGLLGMPAWLVALSGAAGVGTPVVVGGVAAYRLFRWWRGRKTSPPPAAPNGPTTGPEVPDGPFPIPGAGPDRSTPAEAKSGGRSEPFPRVRFVGFETNEFFEAYQWAIENHPRNDQERTAMDLRTLDELIDQKLTARSARRPS